MELISIHIPKTAGVSFRRLLQKVYGEAEVAFDYDDRVLDPAATFSADPDAWAREERASFLDQIARRTPPARVIHGHFVAAKYGGEFPDARRIVWLREPVARLVSHYCYWLELPPAANTLHRQVVENGLSLEEFAELEPMRDAMSRTFLASTGLEALDFVGLQENFDADLRRLAGLLGWPAVALPERAAVENRTGRSDAMLRSLNATTLTHLRALNPGDLELYQRASQRQSLPLRAALRYQ